MNSNPYDSPSKVNPTDLAATLHAPAKLRFDWRFFFIWFAIAMGIQFLAWILMCVAEPIRPIYFWFYFPFFYIFPGPHYPRYGLTFFIFILPVAGSLSYSVVVGLLANLIRKLKFKLNRQITKR